MPYRELQARTASIGATSFASILRTVWGLILLEYLETDKIVFRETQSWRGSDPALVDVVGPLVTVVPVPFQVQAQGALQDVLRQCSAFQEQSKEHYSVHPRTIRKFLNVSEEKALYPAIFNFLPFSGEQKDGDSCRFWEDMDFALGFHVEHAIALTALLSMDDVLTFELTVSIQAMDQVHLEILPQQFDALPEISVENPNERLSHLVNRMPRKRLSITPTADQGRINLAWTQSVTA